MAYINRDHFQLLKIAVDDKIRIGRRTAYSLMGAGLHGRNGIQQAMKAKIWRVCVIPRLLYGIEVTQFTTSELKKLEAYQIKTLKQIQHLPDRVANVSTSLLGILPIEAQLHKNIMNLYYNVVADKTSVEYLVAERQLAVKPIQDSSFFSRVRGLLLLYKLPSAYSILTNTPTKNAWKKMLKQAVNEHVELKWRCGLEEKSSLKYINRDAVKAEEAHHVYSTVRPNLVDVSRAEVKARLLTGTYTLQSNRAVFNQHRVDPTCRLCMKNIETRAHFLSSCELYADVRKKYVGKLRSLLEDSSAYNLDDILRCEEKFTQLTLDCSSPMICSKKPSMKEIDSIELASREYIYKLHHCRNRELARLGP